MLTICNRSRTPWAAAHYGIVAKVNRFSESTRKNTRNFPKYVGYRTKQYHLDNISLRFRDKIQDTEGRRNGDDSLKIWIQELKRSSIFTSL